MKAMTILLEEAKAKDGGRADDPFCCSMEKEPEQVGGPPLQAAGYCPWHRGTRTLPGPLEAIPAYN